MLYEPTRYFDAQISTTTSYFLFCVEQQGSTLPGTSRYLAEITHGSPQRFGSALPESSVVKVRHSAPSSMQRSPITTAQVRHTISPARGSATISIITKPCDKNMYQVPDITRYTKKSKGRRAEGGWCELCSSVHGCRLCEASAAGSTRRVYKY